MKLPSQSEIFSSGSESLHWHNLTCCVSYGQLASKLTEKLTQALSCKTELFKVFSMLTYVSPLDAHYSFSGQPNASISDRWSVR